MKRFQVIIERPAAEDLDHYYRRAVAAGAGLNAARWYNRIVAAILSLEEAAEWRGPVPEQDEFSEKLYQLVFEGRYRIIYTGSMTVCMSSASADKACARSAPRTSSCLIPESSRTESRPLGCRLSAGSAAAR